MAADTEGELEPGGPFTFPVDDSRLFDPFDASSFIKDTRGLFVLHAVLMRTGKVLCFSGHTELVFYPSTVYIYDPAAPKTTKLKEIKMPNKTDLFCCHYVQLHDGRILIIGGSQQDVIVGGVREYHGSFGADTIAVFDPQTEQFVPTTLRLDQGRWYPTAVLLADGRVLAISGRRGTTANPRQIADTVEEISPKVDAHKNLGSGPLLPIYPGIHLAPGGQLYTTHTTWGQEITEPPGQRLTVSATAVTWTPLPATAPNAPAHPQREEGMSVPLPVTKPHNASRGRFLVVGGGLALGVARNGTAGIQVLIGQAAARFTGHDPGADPKSVEILDTTTNPPTWSSVGTLTEARVNGHCVLLPDATVLILGGHDGYKWLAKANSDPLNTNKVTKPSLHVEIYKPGGGFTLGVELKKPRMYHSVALLLPDGRVLVAGGADPNESEPALDYTTELTSGGAGPAWRGRRYSGDLSGTRPQKNPIPAIALNRKDYELYKPPYLCKGATQSTITSITPTQVIYGSTFSVATPQADDIDKVAIMRPGAPTHHTDTEQRYVELDFVPGANVLTVKMVPNTEASIVTPGYYMVWIIDKAGIPCAKADFIQVTYLPPWPDAKPEPPLERDCVVATVTMGSDAPEVLYLRALRAAMAADGPVGNRFVHAVNTVYYSFSPQLASWLASHEPFRLAVAEVVVRPATTLVRVAEHTSRRMPTRRSRSATLMIGLSIQAIGAIAVSPVIGLCVAVHALRSRRRGGRDHG